MSEKKGGARMGEREREGKSKKIKKENKENESIFKEYQRILCIK